MKTIRQKMRSSGGFTLAELLIVVAIIGVLAAVSIPIFTSQLEHAREETDISNMRSAKAAAAAKMLDDGSFSGGGTYYWDSEAGTLSSTKNGITGYGKGTEKDGGCDGFKLSTASSDTARYTPESEVENQIIKVIISRATGAGNNDTITLSWESASV